MAVYFCDSSAVIKRYIEETGSAWVIALTDPATGNFIYIARITGVEVVSAIARQAGRGAITPRDAETAILNFSHDFAHQYQTIEITPALVASAMRLAQAYALRAYDAVQLAAFLEVKSAQLALGTPTATLLSSDLALNHAAAAEGAAVDDPNLRI